MKQKNYIVVIAAFAVMLPLVLFGARPKGVAAAKVPVAQPVNIQLAVDSAMIMADNYCLTMADNPEMARPRLNILKAYYGTKPQAAQDSIRERLFDLYVSYVEQEKAPRAEAMKGAYLALASDTDEHLGAIYANELNIAREAFDTTAVNTYLPLLEAYASRMEYDYDDELTTARRFLHTMRTRRPIRDELKGVWVSDEILKFPLMVVENNSLVGVVLASRDMYYEEAVQAFNVFAFGSAENVGVITLTSENGISYCPLQKEELSGFNIEMEDSRVNTKSKYRANHWVMRPIQYQIDDNSRWLYGLWGTENLKRNNPEVSGAIRQSVQELRATIAGHYSRSNYKLGEKMLANSLADGFSAITNGIIDYFSVSKEKICSAELNLQLQHPKKLIGRIDVIYVEARSDSPTPTIKEWNSTPSYYKWEASDEVFFISANDEIASFYEPSKTDKMNMKEVVKSAKKYWKKHKNGKKFRLWFNEMMFHKLKVKAGEAVPLTGELREIFNRTAI